MQFAGKIPAGVRVSYEAVPFKPYVDELAKRGVKIREIRTKKEKRERGKGKRKAAKPRHRRAS
jgi:hypothetical protein